MTKEEAMEALAKAPAHFGKPTENYYILEDDIHSAEGLTYLGSEAPSVEACLLHVAGAADWEYEIRRTKDHALCAKGVVYLEATKPPED